VNGVGLGLVLANWVMALWAVAWVSFELDDLSLALMVDVIGHAVVHHVNRAPWHPNYFVDILQHRFVDLSQAEHLRAAV
jgi:hypothetical protein